MPVFILILSLLIQPLYAAEQAVDFTRLIEAAGFAQAAYLPQAQIAEQLRSGSYRLTQHHTLPETQVSYFIATDDLRKTQVIAVRGTSNVENALVDIALKLQRDERTGLQLHAGFSTAAKQVYADARPLLKKDYSIVATGHSLGGAVALILAKYLDKDGYRVPEVITFGQPKVTNLAGAKAFNQLQIIRVVTPLDLVPLAPPFDPLDINNLDIYWHSGLEVLLLADNRYAVLEGLDSMLRATRFTQARLSNNNLLNHEISSYLALLQQKKKSSERVPFKNSFNLFNLFGGEK